MGNQQCAACSRETDMFICWDCCRALRKTLDTAAWVAGELEVTLTRQDRIGDPGNRVRGMTDKSMPFHLAASEASWVLRNTLTTWTRDLCETRGLEYSGDTTTPGIARWLAHNSVSLAMSEGAGEAFDEISAAVHTAQRVIDRPAGRLYIGPCGAPVDQTPCAADIYVTMGQAETRCPACGATHSVDERRGQLREQVRGLLGTAAELSRLLPWVLGSAITRKRITYYANKGLIFRRESQGETVYQIGEVIDAHIQCEARRAA